MRRRQVRRWWVGVDEGRMRVMRQGPQQKDGMDGMDGSGCQMQTLWQAPLYPCFRLAAAAVHDAHMLQYGCSTRCILSIAIIACDGYI